MATKGWHIGAIKADQAWAMLTDPHTGAIEYGDVRIGHIDTGYTPHPVFGALDGSDSNLITDQWTNFIETDRREPLDPLDYRGFPGHGTRIGSVMYGDLPGQMRGVAPRCPVVPYRATNTVVLHSLLNRHLPAVGQSIRHGVDQTNCSVLSMSLGTPGIPLRNMSAAVDHAYDAGVIIVAASGNNVSDHVTYPGKYFRTICAGGIAPNRRIWRTHNQEMHGFIDIFAPADKIYRANSVLVDGRAQPGEYRDDGDGTSYATACTAGAAALWLVYRREDLAKSYPEPWMVVEAFRTLLRQTATKLTETPPGVKTGILDIAALLQAKLPKASALKYEKRLAVGQRY